MIFSALTSKIFGAATLALVAYHLIDEVGDNRRYASLKKLYAAELTDTAILRSNVGKYQLALNQCNQSVKNSAIFAQQMGANGRAAVEAVQQAGSRNEVIVRNINAAPAQSCTDAEAILRGEAG